MVEIVAFPNADRLRPREEPDTGEYVVNLDAIGRIWALKGQIAALCCAERAPAGIPRVVIRDGARVQILPSELADLLDQLMEAKDNLRWVLGSVGLRAERECIESMVQAWKEGANDDED